MRRIVVSVCLIVLGLVSLTVPATGEAARRVTLAREPFTGHGLDDLDARPGLVLPTDTQLAAVRQLGATVRWNRFGTPASLIDRLGDLGPAPGSPVEGARAWVDRHRELFRLSTAGVSNLQLLADSVMAGNAGHAVILQQRFGGLPAGYGGLITVGVARGRVFYVSSSAAGDGVAPEGPTMTAARAWLQAARAAGERVTKADVVGAVGWKGWTRVKVRGYALPQVARLTALPLPDGRVRPAFLTVVVRSEGGEVAGYTQLVDARTGKVWVRDNFVDQLAQVPLPYPPTWRYFTASPPLDYTTNDTRALGCWEWQDDCDLVFHRLASRVPWDFNARLNLPTFTTIGNNAITAQAWLSPLTPAEQYRPISPTREYDFGWTNQWYTSKCDPASFLSPQRADIDASVAHLFAAHNRMHDWSYLLGFTERNWNLQDDNFGNRPKGLTLGGEGDPEVGDAQAGAFTGGFPSYVGRTNANQLTPPDGLPGITNQYLFQPIAGAIYVPCADGSYDMTIVGHEYTHAISNRMVAGPIQGLVGFQPGSMGESWSDLVAMEYLNEYGYVPLADENPWAVGPYATGNKQVGIRNYALNRNPLNFSDLAFDQTGAEVHADGEIWNAVNYEVRRALVRKWNPRYPAADRKLQRRCADGDILVQECPGNRRWIQIVFDAFLLMQSDVTMVDARDAYLAADRMRFGGANQAELWEAFARRGLGQLASSTSSEDEKGTPSFASPLSSDEARVTFKAVGADGKGGSVRAKVFVGDFEARVTPVADTDPQTKLTATARFVPGRYRFIVQAPGHGAQGFDVVLGSGQRRTLTTSLPTNWASVSSGSTFSGDANPKALLDDTEATVWNVEGGLARGRQVTVKLGRGAHIVRVVAVSAMRAPEVGGQSLPVPVPPPIPHPIVGNRFSALRQFAVLVCDDTKKDCSKDANFRRIYTSAPDAFPAGLPRPLAPDLTLRTFDVPDTRATHVRLLVLNNQCTGARVYQGELDNDPLNPTDCVSGSDQDTVVQASEFQVFSGQGALR